MGEGPLSPYATKSIEQKTLETLERIEALLLDIVAHLKDPELASLEAMAEAERAHNTSTPRAPKRTRK